MSQQSQQVFNGRYEILRHVARGGMAEVYVAHDQMLDRQVALKVLFPELSTDRNFVERFRREAQAAANLSHPNIVSIYDWGEENGTYFIVMEYIEGRTLGQLIRRDGPLAADRAAEVGAEVAAALAFAHRSGVIHRDVKPGNVLINLDGQVKVADFGIARAANSDQDLTQTGAVMGTATYFSPEQAQGQRVDPRSDVYSLGVMLYEMVVGRPPFSGDNPMAIAYKHVREQPVPPRQRNREIPQAFDSIVLQAMAKNPNDRYTSADELRHDLLRFRQGRMVLANPTMMAPAVDATQVAQAYAADATQVVQRTTAIPPTAAPGPPPPQRGSGAFIALLVVMLAVLGGLLYLFGKEAGLFGQEAPERVEMPFVVGQTADQARQALEDIGLEVQEDTVATDQQEPGKVFEQDPPAGNRVDAGAAVTIRVAAEPEKVKVPDLVGKNVDDARDLAEALGLNLQVTEKNDPSVGKDDVISQSPDPETEIAKGSNVDVVVSAGKSQKAVPDVTGQDASDAANALGQAGFRTRTTREASATVEEGKVIRTEPAAGNNAEEGSTVTIVVSSGVEEATVPNVKGDTAEQAKVKIEGAGLTFVQGPNVPSNLTEDGRVVSQSPSAGAKVDRGSNVVVQIGRFTAGNGGTTTSTSTTSTTGG
ncbi:MAG TPA: Stk1 family PASTA domain-containing Ser/Thr kinase [Acidimicrobiales bacterium]|nr:Stk1 family PASTA domain-containing Ser/Thr kinase [Acidimicrobiales bacterium]